MKKLLFFLFLIPFFLQAQTTWYVQNNNDAGPGSLRQLVADVADGDIIRFDNVLLGETITLTSGEIVIDKGLSIKGLLNENDTLRISGNNNSRIFQITDPNWDGNTVILDSLMLQNGYAFIEDKLNGGGAISLLEGVSLFLNNCFFNNNSTNKYGGALYASFNSEFTIGNSHFIGNEAGFYGGAIFSEMNNLLIHDCMFQQNFSELGGGAVYGTDAWGVVSNSMFTQNYSNGAGGAVYNNGYGEIDFNNCQFSYNNAVSGGAMCLIKTTCNIDSTIFQNNQANNGGGAILVEYMSNLNLTHSSLFQNQAGNGGAIAVDDAGLYVLSSRIFQNQAENGAAISLVKFSSVIITKSSVYQNIASNLGGGVYMYWADLHLNNSTLTANTALSGGAIYSSESYSSTINNSTIVGNSAGVGGGLYALYSNVFTLYSSILSQNSGGDLYNDDDFSECNSNGYNYIGTANNFNEEATDIMGDNNPMLQPLGNYGGATPTMLPLLNSPVVNAGNAKDDLVAQNEVAPFGIKDIGAAEFMDISVQFGCTDPLACNFSATANTDDGSCIYHIEQNNALSVCESYYWIDTLLTNSGVYSMNYQIEGGCDSTVVLNLTVFPSPIVSIQQNGTQLVASDLSFSTYLWSTGDSTPITNVQEDGTYWLIATNEHDCVSDTAFFDYEAHLGVAEESAPLIAYPNPVVDYLIVNRTSDKTIYNLLGEVVLESKAQKMNLSHLPPGVYLLLVDEQYVKFVKE